MKYLLFQAYGHRDVKNECLYALFSFTRFTADVQIVIYTDEEGYFRERQPENLAIEYRNMTPESITEWRGPQNFTHRLKIMMLLDFLKSCNPNDLILYTDTDVTFLQPTDVLFEEISNGKVLMHTNEGNIFAQRKGSRIFKLVYGFAGSGKAYSHLILPGQDMWNAGVLGFRASDVSLIEKVLEITDGMHKVFPTHVTEQLAFSLVFSNLEKRPLMAAKAAVFHYWNFKEFRPVLLHFFAKYLTASDLQSRFENINPLELEKPKRAYEVLSFWPKTLKKFSGRWKMPEFQL